MRFKKWKISSLIFAGDNFSSCLHYLDIINILFSLNFLFSKVFIKYSISVLILSKFPVFSGWILARAATNLWHLLSTSSESPFNLLPSPWCRPSLLNYFKDTFENGLLDSSFYISVGWRDHGLHVVFCGILLSLGPLWNMGKDSNFLNLSCYSFL